MIGHGGHGALLAGLPQVVVPLFADQPYNADRIVEIGAGLRADAGTRPASARPSSACSARARSAPPRGAVAREAFLPPIEAESAHSSSSSGSERRTSHPPGEDAVQALTNELSKPAPRGGQGGARRRWGGRVGGWGRAGQTLLTERGAGGPARAMSWARTASSAGRRRKTPSDLLPRGVRQCGGGVVG